MGSIFRRKEGGPWYIQYYHRGKCIQESSRSKKRTVAKRLLLIRESELADGKPPRPQLNRVTLDDLAVDLLQDYRLKGKKSLDTAGYSVGALRSFFGGTTRARNIGTTEIRDFIEERLEAGLSNSTINRDLRILNRMFTLAAKHEPPKMDKAPKVPKLKDADPRQGFFEHDEYLKLLDALPSYLKPVLTFGYKTGWRKGEILNLGWDRVNLKEGTVRLKPSQTKNSQAKTIVLDEELKGLLRGQRNTKSRGCPYVFHRNGKRIKDFRGTWKKACKDAGLEGKIFHDLRRTAVRNMVRAGVPEVVAMKVSGHKTRSTFERYNIVDEKDLKQAAVSLSEYLDSKVTGKNTGTKVSPIRGGS